MKTLDFPLSLLIVFRDFSETRRSILFGKITVDELIFTGIKVYEINFVVHERLSKILLQKFPVGNVKGNKVSISFK